MANYLKMPDNLWLRSKFCQCGTGNVGV